MMIDRLADRRILLLLTQRADVATPPAFARSYTTVIDLDRLSREQSASLVQAAAGRELPQEVVREIVDRAQGVALYAEELTRSVIDAGMLQDQGGRLGLRTSIQDLAIPTTLQDSLMARLDRLSSTKVVAQIGATLGNSFDYPLLEAVSGLEQPLLQTALQHLVDNEVLRKTGDFPDARFVFVHSLMHDVAYRAQLLATRRELHARVVDVVERRFPDRAAAHPDWMTVHAIDAGLRDRVVHYAELAGNTARDRLAHAEAAAYFQTSIEHLQELPEGEERDAREIGLELARGGALSVARGYSSPEVRACYARIRELNDRLTPGPAQLPGWIGLGQYATMTSTFPELLEAGQQVLEIAEPLPIPMLHALGHLLIGIGSTTSDTPKEAIGHLEEVLRIASEHEMPMTPNDPDLAVAARSTLLIAYQSAGDIERSLEHERLCLERARSLEHAASLALALTMASAAASVARDPEKALRLASEGHALSRERGLIAWRWQNALREAWARLALGESEAIADLREAWAGIDRAGASSTAASQRLFFVNGLIEAGEYAEALAECDGAEKMVDATGESGLLGEIGRYRSYALLRAGQFDAALAEARRVGHHPIGLSLGNLDLARCLAEGLLERGEVEQARDILEPALHYVRGGKELRIVQRAMALHTRLLEV